MSKERLRRRLRQPKEASKTAPKEVRRLRDVDVHEERVLSQEHKDEMIAVSVLLIGTSLVFLYFFK